MYRRLLELLNLVKPLHPHLPQTNVSVEFCGWCKNRLCDSQKFNNTCFGCGKSPYSKQN